MMRRILILFLLMLPSVLFAAEPIYLSGLLIKPSRTASQFTFILSAKTYGKVKYIPNPDRIEIDLANTYRNFDMQKTSLAHANVKYINVEELDDDLRFTFYVTGEAKWEINFLPGNPQDGTRLQLIIKTQNPILKKPFKKPVKLATTALQESFRTDVLKTFDKLQSELQTRKSPQQEILERSQILRHETTLTIKKPQLFTIVIDAGHGGKDSGALGRKGGKEKDIVLSIAKKLAVKMNAMPNVKAVMTRSGDYFVPLRKRLKLAREGKADLFVAIHADAYFEDDATGASVFALSQHGASTEAARWLAQRENYSELGGVELDSLSDRDPILRSVLVDLAQTTTIQDSIRVGNKVLDALETISPLHYTHVERAPFVVLKSPDIPSILVETGFITNPKEEKRLLDPHYQDEMADALKSGINLYIQKYRTNG